MGRCESLHDDGGLAVVAEVAVDILLRVVLMKTPSTKAERNNHILCENDEGRKRFVLVGDEVDGRETRADVGELEHVAVASDGRGRDRTDEIGADHLTRLSDVVADGSHGLVVFHAFVDGTSIARRKRVMQRYPTTRRACQFVHDLHAQMTQPLVPDVGGSLGGFDRGHC